MLRPSLTTRVKVQRRALATNDGAGNTTTAWADYLTGERAQVLPYWPEASTTEAIQAARLEGRSVVFVTLRASAATRAIDTGDRILDLDTDRAYGIIGLDPVGPRDSYIRFACETGRADG